MVYNFNFHTPFIQPLYNLYTLEFDFNNKSGVWGDSPSLLGFDFDFNPNKMGYGVKPHPIRFWF